MWEGGRIDTSKAKSRIYYDIFIDKEFEPPTSLTKWVNIPDISSELFLESCILNMKSV